MKHATRWRRAIFSKESRREHAMTMALKHPDEDVKRTDREEDETPGAAGHPEPGSGHDDSKTTTVEDGPPVEKVDGIPGASGDVEIERQQ